MSQKREYTLAVYDEDGEDQVDSTTVELDDSEVQKLLDAVVAVFDGGQPMEHLQDVAKELRIIDSDD